MLDFEKSQAKSWRSPIKTCTEFSTKFYRITKGQVNSQFFLHIELTKTGHDFDLYVRIYTSGKSDSFV